jgi:hypothetical protein
MVFLPLKAMQGFSSLFCAFFFEVMVGVSLI